MRIAKIFRADGSNGHGMRVSVFVSGCRVNCPGCFNKEAQDFSYGDEYSAELEDSIIEEVSKMQYDGISILGGEPTEPENVPGVIRLLTRFRQACPNKTVWLYTGYLFEQRDIPELWKLVDVVVDGPFVEAQKDARLLYRGSRNQRLIALSDGIPSGKEVECW